MGCSFLRKVSFALGQKFVSALVVLFLASQLLSSANARDFSTTETAQLEQLVSDFKEAMSEKDFARFVEFMPPRVWSHIRDKAKVSDEQLRKALVDVFENAFEEVELVDFGMDFSAASKHDLQNGESYILIPTNTKVRIPGRGLAVYESQTLALSDEGHWFLVRITDVQQQMILKAVYPQFKPVEFPAEKTNFFEE